MAKNIVLCSDGTGNSARKFHGTNVKRVFDAVDRTGGRPRQVAFYDDGVGTERMRVLRMLGGALGLGLSRNIREIYGFLALNYRPGDRIFLFGFSRGGHTVRAVAGMVAKVGIVAAGQGTGSGAPPLARAEFERRVRLAYRVYRECNRPSLLETWLQRARVVRRTGVSPEAFRKDYAVGHAGQDDPGLAPIAFVGVWDTVDAVGAPMPELADLLDALIWRFRFRDFELSGQVAKGCQALALDDARRTFHPVLWDESKEAAPGPDEAPRIEQVWFAGMHADVGGGYARDAMALVPLMWMMERAETAGLKFRRASKDAFRAGADCHGTMHNSRSGLAAYYRYRPRYLDVLAATGSAQGRGSVAGSTGASACLRNLVIHDSVFERARRRVVHYAPVVLPPTRAYAGEDRSASSVQAIQPADLGPAMDLVRDLCWWRQVHYYAFVLLTLVVLLIGFRPHWLGIRVDEPDWPWLNDRIRDADVLIPAVLEQPVGTYAHRPGILLALLAAAAGLYLFNRWVRLRVEAEADFAWRRSFGYDTGEGLEPTALHRAARALRRSRLARRWQWFTRRWWPWLATTLVTAVVVWGVVSLI